VQLKAQQCTGVVNKLGLPRRYQHFSVVGPHHGGKTAGIDMQQRNYATVSLINIENKNGTTNHIGPTEWRKNGPLAIVRPKKYWSNVTLAYKGVFSSPMLSCLNEMA